MAKATAASKTARNVSPRARFSAIDATSAMPAITRICSSSRSIWRASGVLTSCSSASIPEMWPTSVAIPVAVTTNSPAPRVTLVFMYTMSVRSPSGVPAPCTGSVPLETGRPSPVSADSSASSVAAFSSRPSAGHDIARLDRDDVPGDQLPGRDLGQLAVPPHLGLDDRHLLQGGDGRGGLALLPQVHDRVEQRQQDQQDARAELLERVDAADARREQPDLHRVVVLADERVPARLCLPGGELVGAGPLRPRGRLGRAETAPPVYPFGVEGPGRRRACATPPRRPLAAVPISVYPSLPTSCRFLLA